MRYFCLTPALTTNLRRFCQEQTRQIRRDISRYVVPPNAAVFPFLKKSGKVEKWKSGRVLRLFPFPSRHSTFPLFTLLVHRCVPIAYTGVNCRDRHLCIQPTEKRTRHFCRVLRPQNERNAAFAYPLADRPLRRSRAQPPPLANAGLAPSA